MEDNKRNKKYLISAIVCLTLALIMLIPALIFASAEFMVGVIIFGCIGAILLIVYFFEKRAKLICGIFFSVLFVIFLICTL